MARNQSFVLSVRQRCSRRVNSCREMPLLSLTTSTTVPLERRANIIPCKRVKDKGRRVVVKLSDREVGQYYESDERHLLATARSTGLTVLGLAGWEVEPFLLNHASSPPPHFSKCFSSFSNSNFSVFIFFLLSSCASLMESEYQSRYKSGEYFMLSLPLIQS